MTAALALRFGMAPWIVRGIILSLLFCIAAACHHHIYHSGELAQLARDEAKAKIESDRADHERDALNARIRAVQIDLDKARTRVADLEKDNEHEKAISEQRQRDLLAGRERMRVLVRTRSPNPDGPAQGGPAAGVDPDTYVEADLAGTTAAAIDHLRAEHNEAVRRLDACIVEYDAVKAAADAMP